LPARCEVFLIGSKTQPGWAKSAELTASFRFPRVFTPQIDFMPSQIIGGEHGLIAFIVIFGSGMLGLLIGKILPERHIAQPTQAIVQTTMGTISILAALVLGLLVATAKGKFDTVSTQVEQLAGNLMLLDHELRNYGSDTAEARGLLRGYVVAKIKAVWPRQAGERPLLDDPTGVQLLEAFQLSLRGLTPKTDTQRLILADALPITGDLVKTTWRQVALAANRFTHPFLIMTQLWLGMLFFSWGMFAPRNAIVIGAMLLGAASIACTIILVEDFDNPFEGFVTVFAGPDAGGSGQAQCSVNRRSSIRASKVGVAVEADVQPFA
jgi:hypothetical protein